MPKVPRPLTDNVGMISMTTTPGFTGEETNGRRTRVLRIIRWWKLPGMARWRTVHGLENVCLPRPNGKKRRGEPMGENIHGETSHRIGVERILARGGTTSDPSVAYRKARVPMAFRISPEMVGNGSVVLMFLIPMTEAMDARI